MLMLLKNYFCLYHVSCHLGALSEIVFDEFDLKLRWFPTL